MSKQINTSKQSLQKFTDLKTREDFKAFRDNSTLEEFDSYGSYIQDLINKAEDTSNPEKRYKERYYNYFHYWIEQRYPESEYPNVLSNFKNTRWQSNRHNIEQAIHKYLIDHNRLPTNNEIEQRTGLSRITIHKHIKEGTGSDYYKEELKSFKLLTASVLGSLYKIGTEDRNVKALKVFLDYTGGAATTPTTIKQQNNYLQINNTRIDEVTVNNLPEEARLQIEGIIKQYQTV